VDYDDENNNENDENDDDDVLFSWEYLHVKRQQVFGSF